MNAEVHRAESTQHHSITREASALNYANLLHASTLTLRLTQKTTSITRTTNVLVTDRVAVSHLSDMKQIQDNKHMTKTTTIFARVLRHAAFASITSLSLLIGTSSPKAQDAQAASLKDKDRRNDVQPAELNAFGCLGVNGAAFAGRYESIDVFAALATLSARRSSTQALVFGKLVPGPFPSMLSAALVEWTASFEPSDGSFLLHGFALHPDGAKLLVRLRLPRRPGVYNATIRTDNLASGESLSEAIVCTVR